MKGKRDRLLIILQILKLLNSGPATITRVVYGTNLNHDSAKSYISLLESRGFIRRFQSAEGRLFLLTPKGDQVLRDLERVLTQVLTPVEVIA